MDKDLLEVIFKKVNSDTRIARVISVEAEPAVKKGENYCSILLRLKVKLILGNGRLVKKSFILKQKPQCESTSEFIESVDAFNSEVEIYAGVLKEMEYLLEEFGDTDEKMWCDFLYYNRNPSSILLEDLKASGYKMVPRQIGHDMEHAILVLRSLGKYHGMAKILESRGLVKKEQYHPYALVHNRLPVKCFIYEGVMHTRDAMLTMWGPEWRKLAEKLDVTFEEFFEKLKKLSHFSDSEFLVLNHGDCWSNNMMFKYDWKDRPIILKMVDFQIPHYSSPCTDLAYYMYFSIQPSIRRENFNYFVSIYHESLSSTLNRYGYSGAIPTLEEIQEGMDRMMFCGLSFFVGNYPCAASKREEPFDMEELMRSEGISGLNMDIYSEEGMVEKMGPDIINYVDKYY